MKAAVFFPGIGYHCDKPLLYYSRKLAQECGYEETIALSYTYDGGNIRVNRIPHKTDHPLFMPEINLVAKSYRQQIP